MNYVLWAISLLLQNASFTWVSRARNSGSVKYHAVAAVCSNGVWFLNQFIVVDIIIKAIHTYKVSHNLWPAIGAGLFYTLFTVIGSVSMHWFLMRHVEKGTRKVGA